MRADVYRNLHTGLWSIKDRRTGLVVEHAPVVVSCLHLAFAVQPAGHAKVVESGQKNVHAFVRGDWLTAYHDPAHWRALVAALDLIDVSYNPFRGPSFYRKDTGADITEAKAIVMIAEPGTPAYVGAML